MSSIPHSIHIAESDEQITRCFSVLAELRPHLVEAEFLPRVRAMQGEGYELAFVETDGNVQAVAGFRVTDRLAFGKILYVDDLVTTASSRSQGYGDALFDWLFALAKERSCKQLDLDSGVHRFEAHRFYLRKRMKISSHHFDIAVN
ncbi:GNAT family N-acetyltransferase [bacterium]|nr:MAG: GNAT family N-acetyltransferase [bacterium]